MREEQTEKRDNVRKTGVGRLMSGFCPSAFLLFLAAVVLMAIGTLAWMSSGSRTNASGMTMQIDDNLYELMITATPAPTNAPISALSSIFPNPESSTYSDLTGYFTSRDNDLRIELRPEVAEDDDTENLGPGTHGSMTFSFVPNAQLLSQIEDDESIYVTLKMTRSAYDASGNLITSNAAEPFLNGHILLFQWQDPVTSYYSGFPANDSFTFEVKKSDLTDGKKDLTIYWVWPRVLSQLVQTTQPTNVEQIFGDATVAGMRTWMVNSPNCFFKDVTSIASDAVLDTDRSDLNFAYNLADQEIGDNFKLISVVLDASIYIDQSSS